MPRPFGLDRDATLGSLAGRVPGVVETVARRQALRVWLGPVTTGSRPSLHSWATSWPFGPLHSFVASWLVLI